jgi:hypothetical protein
MKSQTNSVEHASVHCKAMGTEVLHRWRHFAANTRTFPRIDSHIACIRPTIGGTVTGEAGTRSAAKGSLSRTL